jgi:protein-tyrosine-phosphatase
MKRILVLCTGNSCRSQMAEGYLKQVRNMIKACSQQFVAENL